MVEKDPPLVPVKSVGRKYAVPLQRVHVYPVRDLGLLEFYIPNMMEFSSSPPVFTPPPPPCMSARALTTYL